MMSLVYVLLFEYMYRKYYIIYRVIYIETIKKVMYKGKRIDKVR